MEYGYTDITHNPDLVKIKIFGVGGGGCNAVNRLVNAKVQGVEFIASNTDKIALQGVAVEKKIQLGEQLTHGLGAGSKPDVGEQAALESKDQIRDAIEGADLVFVTAGMGGGTGTGGAPVVASIAKSMGILTIGVVTKPMNFEGAYKMAVAEKGIAKLKNECDVLVVIPNEKAFDYVLKNTPYIKVMQVADDVLHNSIVGITDIIVKPGFINLDFADLRTVLENKGTAHIGIGRGKGENRVMEALRLAARSPLLESDISGAKDVIVNVVGDVEISGDKVKEALNLLPDVLADNANIISGLGFDTTLKDEAIVTIVATGFGDDGSSQRLEVKSEQDKAMEDISSWLKPKAPQQPTRGYDGIYGTRQTDAPTRPTQEQPAQKSDDVVADFLTRLKKMKEHK